MLKDRHTHRIGRSLASNPYNSQAAGVRYNALTNFNEDEHRESGFRYYIYFFANQKNVFKFLIFLM